ncbi:hypothetical protein ACE3MZ_21955 [Paenibacillus sp. WLX1005]|uniref:hypothetical protein n=1 Tax=Paenibacillus sp. WLX1005 TaxID=3243766 RepID=UPI0039843EA5
MQTAWILLAVGMIAVLFVLVWIALMLASGQRRLPNNNTPRPRVDHDSNTDPHHDAPNVVHLASFRQRRNGKGKEIKRNNSQPEPILKKENVAELHKKAVPATVRPLPLSKSGDVPVKPRLQKCSYCKKEVHRLTFYATDEGGLVGVCKDCEPIAKRQDLLPL